jgi:dolichyl-phosphate-mannose-protein mannosyltransferase
MPASKSSASSRRSSLPILLVVLAALSASAVWWCFSQGYTLYYGDAEAHLNIARRVLDSRTPSGEQLGTVWLPLPHVLMLPLVRRDDLWQSGLAGAIPSAICFVVAGAFLFAAARRAYQSTAAGYAAALLFALNPNMLYLQATPMTEPMFAACLAALLWATLWFRDSQSPWALLAAAAAANAAALTRYEGWFLIPFAALYLLMVARRKKYAFIFAALAGLGPLSWLAHNQYYFSNPLEFYNGEYSAKAIYARQLVQGIAHYPGDHNWRQALQYYFEAVKLTTGWLLLALAMLGAAAVLIKRAWWVLVLLALPAAFYVLSVYSSGTPIYVPHLWPNGWYNTRYGLALLPLAAMAAAALVAILPYRGRAWAAGLLVAGVGGSSILAGLAGEVACWKEAQVNSMARRTWTHQAAEYLATHYKAGGGIIYSFGDLTGVLREAAIPLREGLHQGNRPSWDAATIRPDLFLREEWALVITGDPVATAIVRAQRRGPHYELRKQIIVEGAPVIEIYQRRLPKN